MRLRLSALLCLGMLAWMGCEDDEGDDHTIFSGCNIRVLPIRGGEAPTLIDVTLECQGSNINVLATATDPQGDADLMGIQQTIGIFLDTSCETGTRDVLDDFAGSGVEESFGTVLMETGADSAVFQTICTSDVWPVVVRLFDASGDSTVGRVFARVVETSYRSCDLKNLPLAGGDAPTLVDVALECQGSNINVLATATDPQGDGDLQNVQQTIGVFLDTNCETTPRQVMDDFVGSGVEESFGIVFLESGADSAVFEAICKSSVWPVVVRLADASGDTTVGRLLARVIEP